MTRNLAVHGLYLNQSRVERLMKEVQAMGHPKRPNLDALSKRMHAHRGQRMHGSQDRGAGQRISQDGFIRETFCLPRHDARIKAREILNLYPRQAYWTEIESWRERADNEIEFTMRWLKSAD